MKVVSKDTKTILMKVVLIFINDFGQVFVDGHFTKARKITERLNLFKFNNTGSQTTSLILTCFCLRCNPNNKMLD